MCIVNEAREWRRKKLGLDSRQLDFVAGEQQRHRTSYGSAQSYQRIC